MILNPFSKNISKIYRKESRILNYIEYKEKIKENLRLENVIYGVEGNPIKFYKQPLFLCERETNYFQNLVDKTNSLFEQAYSIILKDRNYLKFLGISPELIDIKRDLNPVSIFRIDGTILRQNKKFKFLEINSNNPGGLYNADNLERILLENDPVLKALNENYNLLTHNRMNAFTKMIINEYDKFKLRTGKNLGDNLLVLGDRKESPIVYSQLLNYLSKNSNFQAYFAYYDSTKINYDRDGSLYFNDKKIAVVNRRVHSRDDLKNIKMLAKASLKEKVLVLNKFSSSILGMKKFYLLLQEKSFQQKLSQLNVDFIKEYIPKTFDFNNINSISDSYLLNKKNEFVIKINNSEKGDGVFIGENYSNEEWKNLIKEFRREQGKLKYSTKIVQEFLNMTKVESREYDYNLLSIGGIFMPFARIASGENMKTNIAQGGEYIPCFKYTKK